MLRSASACLILAGIFLLAGCGATGTNGGSNTPTGATGQGKLYVSDSAQNTIFRFDGALTAKGALKANVTISGAATTLANPGSLIIDAADDLLFVANRGAGVISPSILIFQQAHLKTGNMAPERAISGNATQLIAPADMALDIGNNLLYVADQNAPNATPPGPGIILIFSQPLSASGNATPARTLTLSFVPTAIFLDTIHQQLFVADGAHNAIDIFNNVNNLSGAISATQIITKGTSNVDNTLLSSPGSLQLDSAGRLVVGNATSQAITIYANAATATGNVAPAAVIGGGSTGISAPAQITLNTGTSDLYLADGPPGADGGILIFDNVAVAAGSVTTAPARAISGLNPNATPPNNAITANGIALDTTR